MIFNFSNKYELESSPEVFKDIILSSTVILDVRSEGEFAKATLPNSINVPILNNEDRHLVGIEYKEKGSGSAIKLGNKLVSGEKKENILKAWKTVIDKNKSIVLMCQRGGLRSQITKSWIMQEFGIELPRLTDGYKAFRNYLIANLETKNIEPKSLILNGYTGSRKTDLIKRLSMAIDLEGLANHRGSAFGSNVLNQPSQATFENRLAFEVIKMVNRKPKFMVFECESKGIGSVNIPNSFYDYMYSGNSVFLELPFSDRVRAIYEGYVLDDLKSYSEVYGYDAGFAIWKDKTLNAINRIKQKLGKANYEYCLNLFEEACVKNTEAAHNLWVGFLLENYYDPMYMSSIKKKKPNHEKFGSADELYDYLEEKNSN